MFTIFCKKATRCSSFTGAYSFVFKGSARLRYFASEDLIAGNAVFNAGALKDQPFAIITEISFGIVAAKSQLLNVPEMFFFRIQNGIGMLRYNCCGQWLAIKR